MYAILLRYRPNEKNPKRASGRGVYRVHACIQSAAAARDILVVDTLGEKRLMIVTPIRAKPKSRVDPLKLALEQRG